MMTNPKERKSKVIDEEMLRVAANFKRLRKERGWTIVETGRQGKVSYKYIGHIESCWRGLGRRGRAKWAKIFGVDVDEFLKHIDRTEFELEVAELKKEVERYSLEKIKRLRQILPILLGEEVKHGGTVKGSHKKNHSP